MANISDFKSQLIGGGARANQFRVQLSFPQYIPVANSAQYKGEFLCKAAQLPASTLENTPVLYRGRQVNFAGERTFAPWTVTILNDTDFGLRNAFEAWMNGINDHTNNTGRTAANQYQVDLQCFQLDRNGGIVKQYDFRDAYPLDVSAIALSFDVNNEIETFDVTFQYNFWTSPSSTQGSVTSLNIRL